MTIGVGNKITAEQFNGLIDQLAKLWADDYSSTGTTPALFSETGDKTYHSYGWGQNNVDFASFKVAPTTTITGLHTNKIRSVLNAALYHTNENASLLPSYAPGETITAATYYTIKQILDNFINTPARYNLNGVDIDDAIIETISNNGAVWDGSTQASTKASFNSYEEARHFFNSGGVVTLNLEATNGYGTGFWDNVFDNMQEIRISAEETYNQGSAGAIVGVPRGYVDLPANGSNIDLFSYQGYGGDETGDYTSEYSDRVVTVMARAEETLTSFDIYITVQLSETIVDHVNDDIITLDVGYILPLESPSDAYIGSGSNALAFIADGISYQFQERTAPTITLDSIWS
jgi:hypothetical protein